MNNCPAPNLLISKNNAWLFHKTSKPSSCIANFFKQSFLAQSNIFWCWSIHFYTWLITKKCLADVILFCFITLSIEFISDSRPSIFVNIFCFIFFALVWLVGITSIWNKRRKHYMVRMLVEISAWHGSKKIHHFTLLWSMMMIRQTFWLYWHLYGLV